MYYGEKRYNKEAVLYYLYMMSDGEVTYSEEKLFNEICKELKINEEEKKTAIEKCKEIVKESHDMPLCPDTININKLDEQGDMGIFGIRSDKSHRARIIWNLVNLGYADEYYSYEEKEMVNYLCEKWGIGKEVSQEMVDTADTILALTKQKEWIVSTFPKGSERDEKEKRIDSEISKMISDVKITIAEMTM